MSADVMGSNSEAELYLGQVLSILIILYRHYWHLLTTQDLVRGQRWDWNVYLSLPKNAVCLIIRKRFIRFLFEYLTLTLTQYPLISNINVEGLYMPIACIGILTFWKYWHLLLTPPAELPHHHISLNRLDINSGIRKLKQYQRDNSHISDTGIPSFINENIISLMLFFFDFRYNMEKFAGQPIDTLADSRRWVKNIYVCYHIMSDMFFISLFVWILILLVLLCGMKVAHNAKLMILTSAINCRIHLSREDKDSF